MLFLLVLYLNWFSTHPTLFFLSFFCIAEVYFDFCLHWLDFIISSETNFHFILQENGSEIIRASEFFLPPGLKKKIFFFFLKFNCLTMAVVGVHQLFQAFWNMVYPVHLYFSSLFDFIKQFLLVHR